MTEITLGKLRNQSKECRQCDFHLTRKNVVFGTGDNHSKIMVISLAPGEDADETGLYWEDKDSKAIAKLLKLAGIDKYQVYASPVVLCKPSHPIRKEDITICLDWIESQIALLMPKIIIIFGERLANTIITGEEKLHEGIQEQMGMTWIVVPSIQEGRDSQEKREIIASILKEANEVCANTVGQQK